MLVILLFFIFGLLIVIQYVGWWFVLLLLLLILLVVELGLVLVLVLSLVVFIGIVGVMVCMEKVCYGILEILLSVEWWGWWCFFCGFWLLVWGVLVLVLFNFFILYFVGCFWGIMLVFVLWGVKIVQGVGLDVGVWVFWQMLVNVKVLVVLLWEDIISVMDIGIVFGVLFVVGLVGCFVLNLDILCCLLVVVVIGGLLFGYGVCLVYGCNIGVYFSGIVFGSLYGWLWLVVVFVGNSVGVWVLRFYFFLEEWWE